jgi:tetratricopeptide (TPR) repeat protein
MDIKNNDKEYSELINIYKLCEEIIESGDLIKAHVTIIDNLEKYPGDLMLQYLLGKTFYLNEMVDKSVSIFEKIIKIEPHFHIARNDLALLYYKLNKKEDSIELLKAAVDKNKYNYDLIRNYADILSEECRYEEAIRVYIKILKEYKNDEEVLLIMAEFSLEAERYDDAKIYVNELLKLNNSNSRALEILEILKNYYSPEIYVNFSDKKKN